MNDKQYICGLCRLIGHAIGVIEGSAWRDDVGPGTRKLLGKVAAELSADVEKLRKSALGIDMKEPGNDS